MKASILLAIKREQRNRRSTGFRDGLHENRETKSSQDAVITQVAVEEPTSELPKTQAEWAKELGIQKQTLTKYMKRHECTLEEAVEYYKSR